MAASVYGVRAKELRDKPELLHSAYLFRGAPTGNGAPAPAVVQADMTVTEMEHVLVLSDDIEATREFYCDVVGLRVGERPPLEFRGYWLYAGTTPCLHIAERHAYLTHAASLGLAISREPPGTGPVDHIAFNANDYDSVRSAADHERCPLGSQPCAGRRAPAAVLRGPQWRARRDQRAKP